MSREYTEFTIRFPESEEVSDEVAERGEVMCEALSKSEFSDDFKNDDIILNYDTPNELYIALSTDFTDNNDCNDFFGILLESLAEAGLGGIL